MMFKVTNLLILLLFPLCTVVNAQQLSNQVLVPAAGMTVGGSVNYSHSIGETAVEIMSGSGFVLTQGFQQPAMKVSTDPLPLGTGVDVYPNPATDNLYVKLFGETKRNFRIEIINFNGRIVSTLDLEFITKYFHIEKLDVSGLTIGFYFVRVTSDDAKILRIFKIEKM